MNTNFLQDNSLPLQFGVLKIKDNSNSQFRNPQIVQHQSTLVISNSVNNFCINHDTVECDQVGDKKTDFLSFVKDIEQRLLAEWNVFAYQTQLLRRFYMASRATRDQACSEPRWHSQQFEKLLLWPIAFRYSCPFVFISG